MLRAIAMMLISLKVLLGPAVCACSFAEWCQLSSSRCSEVSVSTTKKACGCSCGHRAKSSQRSSETPINQSKDSGNDCPCKTDDVSFFVTALATANSSASLHWTLVESFFTVAMHEALITPVLHKSPSPFVSTPSLNAQVPLFRAFSVILC